MPLPKKKKIASQLVASLGQLSHPDPQNTNRTDDSYNRTHKGEKGKSFFLFPSLPPSPSLLFSLYVGFSVQYDARTVESPASDILSPVKTSSYTNQTQVKMYILSRMTNDEALLFSCRIYPVVLKRVTTGIECLLLVYKIDTACSNRTPLKSAHNCEV